MIDLPVPGALAAPRSLIDEPLHILRWISEEEANLVGKGAALPHAADQVKNGFGTAAEIVTALCEKPDGAPILQVCSKAGGAVQVDHDLSVGIVKRNDPKALACQCAIQFPQIVTEGIPVFQFTGEYITGL